MKKKINFFLSGTFSNLGNIFSPQIHDYSNNIEILVFITFKITPCLTFFWCLLRCWQTINHSISSIFLFLLSFFKISKTPDISPFVISFFPFLVLKSVCCYDCRLVFFLFFTLSM